MADIDQGGAARLLAALKKFVVQYPEGPVAFVDVGGRRKGVLNALALASAEHKFFPRMSFHVMCPHILPGDAVNPVPMGVHGFGVSSCEHRLSECDCLPDVPRFYYFRHSLHFMEFADVVRMGARGVGHIVEHITDADEGVFSTAGGHQYRYTHHDVNDVSWVHSRPDDRKREEFDHRDLTGELARGYVGFTNGVESRTMAVRCVHVHQQTGYYDFSMVDTTPRVPAKHVSLLTHYLSVCNARTLVQRIVIGLRPCGR